jgi:hypothetical protein
MREPWFDRRFLVAVQDRPEGGGWSASTDEDHGADHHHHGDHDRAGHSHGQSDPEHTPATGTSRWARCMSSASPPTRPAAASGARHPWRAWPTSAARACPTRCCTSTPLQHRREPPYESLGHCWDVDGEFTTGPTLPDPTIRCSRVTFTPVWQGWPHDDTPDCRGVPAA